MSSSAGACGMATVKTQAEAQTLITQWRSIGFDSVIRSMVERHDQCPGILVRTVARDAVRHDDAARTSQVSETPGPASGFRTSPIGWPNGSGVLSRRSDPGRARKRLDRLRLFSVATRQYLRRRAWRYFRRMGKNSPERYIAAISRGLVRYTDEDVSDGLALIDNWGLTHALFHRSR